MIRKFFTIMIWFALNFALPAFLIIFGLNMFMLGTGIHYHIDYNSFTFLGLWIVRAGLPVTPPSKPIKMMPLKTLDPDDPFAKELESVLREQFRQAAKQRTKPKDDQNGGPGSGAPRC